MNSNAQIHFCNIFPVSPANLTKPSPKPVLDLSIADNSVKSKPVSVKLRKSITPDVCCVSSYRISMSGVWAEISLCNINLACLLWRIVFSTSWDQCWQRVIWDIAIKQSLFGSLLLNVASPCLDCLTFSVTCIGTEQAVSASVTCDELNSDIRFAVCDITVVTALFPT